MRRPRSSGRDGARVHRDVDGAAAAVEHHEAVVDVEDLAPRSTLLRQSLVFTRHARRLWLQAKDELARIFAWNHTGF